MKRPRVGSRPFLFSHSLSSSILASVLVGFAGLTLSCSKPSTPKDTGSKLSEIKVEVRDGQVSEHRGFRVKVADTVGAGDAFTAGLVHEYLHGASLDLMNEVANLVGAWVASEVGAMPTPKRGALENSLAEIR